MSETLNFHFEKEDIVLITKNQVMASEATPLIRKPSTEESTNGASQLYSVKLAFIYVFNLIIGAGVLALPRSFAKVGWLLGLLALCFLALVSYITVTFTIEAMSLANAMLRYTKVHAEKEDPKKKKSVDDQVDVVLYKRTQDHQVMVNGYQDEGVTNRKTLTDVRRSSLKILDDSSLDLDSLYDISVKLELGDMSRMFFNRFGVVFYYISICLYLYGSATVYVAIVCKSLTTVTCDDVHAFDGGNSTTSCRRFANVGVLSMYRIMLAGFAALICPFAYFEIKNTKLLQLFTTGYRWFSMISMIILALLKIAQNPDQKNVKTAFSIDQLPSFIGVALYAFMCQHSIPAVTTNVKEKKNLTLVLGIDFICIVVFYSTILVTAVLAFPEDSIQDVYTLNFSQPRYLGYVLQLFPVLTLSATFPVFSIVLRDNIKALFLTDPERYYGFFLEKILFSTISVVPPLVGAFLTYDVESLVNYTGSYLGAIIQYVIPTALVFFGRRQVRKAFGVQWTRNQYQSPFKGNVWIVFVILWYLVCLAVVTYNTLMGK